MDNRMQLRRRIQAYQFAIWEMTLYLDTHPHDTCALAKRAELMAASKRCREEYESQYGTLIITSQDVPCDATCWSWVDSPWPWECERGN